MTRLPWRMQITVRSALYMAVPASANHNPDLRAFYQRTLAKGRPKQVALAATMRKLIVLLNTVVARGTKWQPERPRLSTQSLSQYPQVGAA